MEQTTETVQPAPVQPELLKYPTQLLAFGFGSGLSPRAPGTMGTLVAIPFYLVIAQWDLLYYSLFVVAAAIAGCWLCGVASRQLRVHDHPGIVWDEMVGFWVTMWAVPAQWTWIVLGFLVFRFLDIVKPWPISYLDRKVHGGVGIMVDDLLAGVMACITLQLAQLPGKI